MTYANKVLAYFINDKEDKVTMERAAYFIYVFDNNIFEKKYFYFYELLREANILKTTLTKEMLDSLCKYSLPDMIKRHKVVTTTTEGLSFSEPSAFRQVLQGIQLELSMLYEECMQEKDDESNYKVALLEMKEKHLTEMMRINAVKYVSILSGDDTKQIGVNSALAEMKTGIAEIESVKERFDEVLQMSKKTHKPQYVCSYNMGPLDNEIGGLISTELNVVSGSSGQGKTTFALCNIVYPALVVDKINVCYMSIDQSELDLQDKLIATHVNTRYKLKLSPRAISLNKYDDDSEAKTKINSARYLLFEADKRGEERSVGKFVVVEAKDIFSNTIIDTVVAEEHKHHVKFDLVVIDYGSAIQHKRIERENLTKEDVVREVYSNAKYLALGHGKAVICLEQYTREGGVKIEKSQSIADTDLAGGMYVPRYADNIICMTGNKEERAVGRGYLEAIKTRNAQRPPKFMYQAQLNTGTFVVQESEV